MSYTMRNLQDFQNAKWSRWRFVFHDVTLWELVQIYQCFRGSKCLQHISKYSPVSTAWHPTAVWNFIIDTVHLIFTGQWRQCKYDRSGM